MCEALCLLLEESKMLGGGGRSDAPLPWGEGLPLFLSSAPCGFCGEEVSCLFSRQGGFVPGRGGHRGLLRREGAGEAVAGGTTHWSMESSRCVQATGLPSLPPRRHLGGCKPGLTPPDLGQA